MMPSAGVAGAGLDFLHRFPCLNAYFPDAWHLLRLLTFQSSV
jgi:hypothetical protein